MQKQLRQDIKKVNAFAIQTITVTTNGRAIDTKLGESFSFETALFHAEVGTLGDQTSTKIKIQESDVSDFSSGVQTAEGGDEVTVAADKSYKFEVKRAKRYLRAVVTITGGTTPSAVVYIGAILWNVSKPFPILS